MNLRIPGPTPCPEEVVKALGHPMMNHRGPEFKNMLYKTTCQIQQVVETKNDVYILTASGTGALEASIVNTLSPGDSVLALSIGSFGNRFAELAEAYGANVSKIEFPWGSAVDPSKVYKALKDNPHIKAVLVTHNETSTGVTNDLETIAAIVKDQADRLLLVDGISSVGSIPSPVDKWQVDIVATGSQKGLMTPPGLAFLSVSTLAWQAFSQAKMPRFYFDLEKAKSFYERGQTPFTPALSAMYGLEAALDRFLSEGLENVFHRHAELAQMTREGIKALGLSLFPDEKVASNTTTAVKVPEGIDGNALLKMLRNEHNLVLGGGQEHLSGKIFRVGHMGYCTVGDIQQVLESLKEVLPRLGFRPSKVSAKNI